MLWDNKTFSEQLGKDIMRNILWVNNDQIGKFWLPVLREYLTVDDRFMQGRIQFMLVQVMVPYSSWFHDIDVQYHGMLGYIIYLRKKVSYFTLFYQNLTIKSSEMISKSIQPGLELKTELWSESAKEAVRVRSRSIVVQKIYIIMKMLVYMLSDIAELRDFLFNPNNDYHQKYIGTLNWLKNIYKGLINEPTTKDISNG